MNKRQKKKREKKYLPVVADETNLLTMIESERTKAMEDYKKYRERYAYRKKYKNLKSGGFSTYHFPMGKQFSDVIKKIKSINKNHKPGIIHTQSLSDFSCGDDSLGVLKNNNILNKRKV